jgi:hypothetical protein
MLVAHSAFSQNRAPSPASKVEQKVGLTDITVEYSRPSVKDRTIFAADGLVPFGKIWRTGANLATKITFSDDIRIGEQSLAAGSYAITTTPNSSEWAIHFHTFGETGWGTYRDKEPALTVKAEATTTDVDIESFMINFTDLRDNSATLFFAWENTIVGIPLQVK